MMRNLGWLVAVTLSTGFGAHAGGAASSPPGAELCTSKAFRDAFLEGQHGAIDDYTGPSAGLVAMGNRVLPCLEGIVEHGGAAYGIAGCREGKVGCEGWALTAIRKVGTPEARGFLVRYLEEPKGSYLTAVTMRALGSLREVSARPSLLRRLSDQDPALRAEAIAALGGIGDPTDAGPMLEATLKLPDEQVYTALQGFRMIGNTAVIGDLRRRVDRVVDAERRASLHRNIDQWESEFAENEKTLAALSAGTPTEVVAALRRSGVASPAILSATRELLTSTNPEIRAEAVVSLCRRNSRSDFDDMLKTVLALPEDRVARGAEGLSILAEPRAIEPLQRHATGMKSPAWRRELQMHIDDLRRKTTPPLKEARQSDGRTSR